MKRKSSLKKSGSHIQPTHQNSRRLLRFLSRNREKISPLLILTHDYPDPDALASAFALQSIAERAYGIQSRIAYGGVIGRMENRAMVSILKMPVHKIKPSDFKKYEHAALIDTQPSFENNSFPKKRYATLVIDQHPSVTTPASEFSIVDTECGATSVILAQALLMLHMEIPVSVATALAYGILSDTLHLYRAVRPDIIQTYLHILRHADLKALAFIQNPSRSKSFFTTLGKGIRKAMVRRSLIVSHLGFVESPDLVSQIADFLLTYRRMEWALATGRYNGKLHVSLRSDKPNVLASEILRDVFLDRGEAGGHDTIAGGSFKVGEKAKEAVWKKAEDALVGRLLKRLRIPVRGEFYFPFREKKEAILPHV